MVVCAGTNDLFRSSSENIKNAYDLISNKLVNYRITVILVPPRTDIKRYNYHIKKLNSKIRSHIAQYENFDFIDPFKLLKNQHLSNDGLHLDRKGKEILCYKILSKVCNVVLTGIPRQGEAKSKTRTSVTLENKTRSFKSLYQRSVRPSELKLNPCSGTPKPLV